MDVRPSPRRPRAQTVFGLAALLALAACGSWLPRTRAENPSPFDSYESAQRALERVQPYRTTVAELVALGFDLAATANVEQVPYPQWLTALMHPSLQPQAMDPGIRDCIAAEQACRAFIFRYGVRSAKREGGFVADFLNFRRETRTVGWRFESVMLVRDGVVLFRSHGGQPHIEQLDVQRNPLGPLQSMGETRPRELLTR